MAMPLDVCFHNLHKTDAIQKAVEKHAHRFERVFPRILACRVTIDGPPRHHRHGNPIGVRIDLFSPGREIVVNPLEGAHAVSDDLYISIRESFKAAARQLKEYKVKRNKGKRRRAAETPAVPDREKEAELEENYGLM